MKILHLITGLQRGGAETMLLRLATVMKDPALVVSLSEGGELEPDFSATGLPILSLGMRSGRFSSAAIAKLRALIKREQPQILQTWLYHADLIGLLAAAGMPSVRLVWNLRCSDMDLSQYGWTTRAVRRALALASRRPAAVIVNSEAGRRVHAAFGYRPRHWELIPNGFDTEQLRPDPLARRELRRQLGVAEETPLIGIVARVDPMKDHPNFLAAAERLVAARDDVGFLLVGRGTDSLILPAALRGRAHALGGRNDIPKLLPALDVLVVSSAYGEGFPNVIGEAMACGVPCVSTDVGDAALIIAETGAIVPPRDPDALSKAILAVLARGRAAGPAARLRIVNHYAIDNIAARYRALYERLTSTR